MDNEIISGKIILLGDTGVGKTTLSNWILTNSFSDKFKPTVGGNFISKQIPIQSTTINLQIWDTAGEERYRSIIPLFYHDVKGAILVYSITEKKTLDEIDFFNKSLNDQVPDSFRILVGNKSDMEDSREVSYEEGEQYAEVINSEFIEVSSKTGDNVDDLLQMTAQQIYNLQRHAANETQSLVPNDNKSQSCKC